MDRTIKFLGAALLSVLLFSLLIPIIEGASNSTRFTPPGRTQLSMSLQVVPDSTTDLSTTDTDIYQLTVTNTTGSACTLTITDKQASVKSLLDAVSIAAHTTYVIAWPEGAFMDDGVSWSAGTASCLHASIKAMKK